MLGAKKLLALLSVLALCSCSASGTDWYYHWSCNGDSECLATNPTGAASGTVGPEAGGQSGCNSLLTFGSKFWNIPPATQSCDTSPSAPPAALVSLTIAPANSTLPLGLSKQFTATAHYSDTTSKDVTSQSAWGTNAKVIGAAQVITVTAGGVVTAAAAGSGTLIADFGGLRATTSVSVGAATVQSLTVAPTAPTIPSGTTQAFSATAHYSDGTSQVVTTLAVWLSSATAVATVSATGLATGVATGTATITATRGGLSGSATLTVGGPLLVSISVTPPNATVPIGYTNQYRAVGVYSDGSSQDLTVQAAWSSGTPAVASVSAGLATGVSAGASSLQSSVGAVSGGAVVTVSSASLVSIAIVPASPSLAPGTSVQLAVVGTFSDGTTRTLVSGVSWHSGSTAVATVSAGGLAAALTVGTSILTATLGALSASTLLTVTLTPPGVTWTFDLGSPVMVPCNGSQGCAFANFELHGVTWSGTQFVAVANDGGIFSSPDGLAWTVRVPGPDHSGVGADLRAVAWSPSLQRFVAVGNGYVTTSSDLGGTWTANSGLPVSGTMLYGVAWSGALFVAVGSGAILTSPDGLAWTVRTHGTSAVLRSVVWSGSQFVAVGDATLTSPDGVHWAQVADGGTGWYGIAWSGGQFAQVGGNGAIRTSPDGNAWTAAPTQPVPLYAIIWTGTQWVAVGGSRNPGYIATSPDGLTWTSRTIGAVGTTFGVSETMYGVAWSGITLVAVGGHYNVTTSP